MGTDAPVGFEPAPTYVYGKMQVDPRAEEMIRLYLKEQGLQDDEIFILIKALTNEIGPELEQIRDRFDHLAYLSENLITKVGSVKRYMEIRQDDWEYYHKIMADVRKSANTLAKNPLWMVLALLVYEKEKRDKAVRR